MGYTANNIMEKYGNKSSLMKFVHKNTGYIVAAGFTIVVITAWLSVSNEQEFFEKWTCPQIQNYLLIYNQDIHNEDFPDHEHLSEEQHAKLHEIIAQCNFEGVFEHKD